MYGDRIRISHGFTRCQIFKYGDYPQIMAPMQFVYSICKILGRQIVGFRQGFRTNYRSAIVKFHRKVRKSEKSTNR